MRLTGKKLNTGKTITLKLNMQVSHIGKFDFLSRDDNRAGWKQLAYSPSSSLSRSPLSLALPIPAPFPVAEKKFLPILVPSRDSILDGVQTGNFSRKFFSLPCKNYIISWILDERPSCLEDLTQLIIQSSYKFHLTQL